MDSIEIGTERVVCRCLNITESDIAGALVSLDIQSVKELCCQTEAGTGCTACHRELQRLFQKYNYASASPICSVK
jgi:bacterioferritin-associated ferredoxin